MVNNGLKKFIAAFLIWLIGGWPTIVFALPQDGQVVGGDASGEISHPTDPNGPDMQIDQYQQQMIINWQSFNIGSGEWVNFTQPNVNAIALNRVIGSDPSILVGKLTGNGQIFISNGSGVFFSPGSTVDTHGFVATTMGIADQDFLDGNYNFTQDPGNLSSVINEGNISATSYVGLLAPAVENRGEIVTASLGSIDLASGMAATMDFTGDGLIQFEVTEAVSGTVLDKDGNELKDRVSNKGLLQADGGQIRMSAKDAGDVIRHVVNMEGMIKANSVVEKDGKVFLMGGDSGVVNVSGTIDASGDDAGEKGGTVHVTGEYVGLFDEAKVDVSGDAGGGEALIGGDYQGKNDEVQNAKRTYVGENAIIDASGGTDGDGGKVIVWADDITRFYGSVIATGGVAGGDGGFAEVSGKNYLDFQAHDIRLGAENGEGGTLLLDPTDITISTSAESNNTSFNPPGDNLSAFADDSGTTNFQISTSFANVGAGTTIELQATNDITISSAWNLFSSTSAANVSVVLRAGNNININAAVTLDGTGTLTLEADGNTADGTGDVVFGASGSVTTGGGNVDIITKDINITSGSINAGSGNVSITQSVTGNIGLGDATCGGSCDMTISGAELQNITAANLTISTVGTAASIIVDNITAGNSDNIGTVILDATADNSAITFSGTASTFNAITANSDDAISLLVDLTTDTGNMILEGDADNSADAADNISISAGVTLTSAGTMTLDATTGGTDPAGNATFTAASGITINDTFTISTGTVNFNSDTTMGILSLTGGILNLNGANVDLSHATILWNGGGDIQGIAGSTLTTTAGGGMSSSGSGLTLTNVIWNNQGSIAWSGAGGNDFAFTNSTFNNIGTFQMQTSCGGGCAISGTGTFNNSGTIITSTSSSTQNISIPFNNTNQVNVTTGDLILNGNGTDTGDYAVSASRTLTLGGTTRSYASTTDFTGLGTVDWGSGTHSVNGSTFASTLTALVSGGTVNVDADTTIPTLSISGGVLNLNGATVELTVNNDFTWTNGNITGTAGSIFTTTGGVTGGTITNTGLVSLTNIIWNNSGKIDWGGSNDLSMIGTTLNNTGSFDITVTTGTNILNTSSSVINNSGTFTHNSTSNVLVVPEFNNTGQTNVSNTGQITLSSAAGVTDTGHYEVTNVAGVITFGGTRTFDAARFSGAGAVVFSTGTFTTNSTLEFEDINTTFTQTIGGTGTVLFTASAGTTIGVGAGAGTVSVTDAELDQITTTNIIIGNSSAGDVTVDSVSNTASTFTIISGADVAFSGGASSFSGNLSVTAGNDMTQAASLSVTGTSSFTVTGTNTMTLDNAANDFTGAVSLFSGTGLVTITDTTSLTLAASTLGGALTVNADDGVTLSGSVTTAGATTIDADVDNTAGGDFSISSGTFNTGNNDLTVTANDVTINISGAATLNVGTGKATFTRSTSGTIGVGDSTCGGTCGMQISGSEIEAITAANLEIANSSGAMTIENVTLANTANISNTLTLTSGTTVAFETTASSFANSLAVSSLSDITQNVAITVGGSSSFTNTAGNVTMNHMDNDLGTNLTLSTIGSFDVDVGNTLTDLNLTVDPGGSDTYSITATGLTFNVTDGGANVRVTSVSQSGLNFSLTAGSGNIELADGAISTGSGNVSLVSTLGNISEVISSTTANITTTGAVNLTAGTSIGTSGANNEVDIFSATDLTFSVGTDLFVSGNNQTITNLNVTVDPGAGGPPTYTISNIAGQTFTMTSDGTNLTVTDVSNTGAANQSITAKTGNVTVTNLDSNGGNIAVIATAGNIVLGNAAIDAVSGSVTVTSVSGSITEGVTNTSLNLQTTGAIFLTAGTSIGTSGVNEELDFSSASATSLTIDVNVDFYVRGSGADLTDLNITVNPANTSTYMLTNIGNISAFALSELSGDANISITATALNFNLNTDSGAISTVGAIDVGTGSLSITNNDTTVGSSITFDHTVAAGALTVTANGQYSDININKAVMITSGDVTLTADDAVNFGATDGDLTASGAGNVVVTANNAVTDGNSFDVIQMSAGSSINAGSGTITLTAVGTNSGNNTFRALTTTSNSSSALVIRTLGNITISDTVSVTGGGTTTFDTSSGTGTITATDSSNDFTGAVSVNAGNGLVQITDTNAFVFGTSTATGEIAVVAGGAVTQTGAITADGLAVTTSAGGTVTLENVLNDVDHLATSAAGNVSFVDADDFEVATVNSVNGVSTSSGSVHLTATTGNVSVNNTSAANDIDATAGISITLSGTDAIFHVDSTADVENNSSGDIDITADNMVIFGTITASGQRVKLKSTTADDAVNLGFLNTTASNTLELSDAELYAITANYLEIGSTTQGAFTVSSDVRPANVMVAHLISNSTVTGTAGGIVVTQLAIEAGGEVNFTDTTTDVDLLAIDATGFDATFYDVDDLDINTVDTVVGVKAKTFTTNGPGPRTDTSAVVLDTTETVTEEEEEQVDEGSQSTFLADFTSPADSGC